MNDKLFNKLILKLIFVLRSLFVLTILVLSQSCQTDVHKTGQKTSYKKEDTRNKKESTNKLLNLLNNEQTGVKFINKNEDTEDINVAIFDYFYNGGGVSISDINNDNLPDIFFTGNLVSNRLYLNKGNFQFEDITESSGILNKKYWSNSATFLDINSDGWLDIYVANGGMLARYPKPVDQLFINNKNNTFTESAKDYGLLQSALSSQLTPIDFDLDGDLDLFLMKHTDFQNRFKKFSKLKDKYAAYDTFFDSETKKEKWYNTFYENEGNGSYSIKTMEVGLFNWGYGLSVVVSDLNKDNYPDIYVSNDYLIPDFLYINNGDGTFTDKIKEKTGHISHFGMGCDIADFNNDTWPDIAVVDMTSPDRVRNKTLMSPMKVGNFNYAKDELGFAKQYMFNTFQVNNGGKSFSEIGNLLHLGLTDWSWSSLLADFDLDGDKDYFITNGYKRDSRHRDIENEIYVKVKRAKNENKKFPILDRLEMLPSVPTTNYLFENTLNYQFKDVSSEWGFTDKSFSNGAAYADLDNDGDLDLVINNINKKAWLFKNTAVEQGLGNYLKIKFTHNPKNYNAKVTLYNNDTTQYQEFHPVRGYFSCMEPMVHFGLGKHKKIDSLVIQWLYGKEKRMYNVEINQTLILSIDDVDVKDVQLSKPSKKMFTKVNPVNLNINYQHKENLYRDFKKEILLPHSQSRNGPNIAVADVNGDGLDDFYVGGAHKQAGQLYIQKINGKFMYQPQEAFAVDAMCENMGVHFFDYDNDGDKDLYVVCGGNEFRLHRGPALVDKLYRNDGKGNFSITRNVLSTIGTSGSKVASADYNNDGKLDLLIAGRILPQHYPIPATSILLKNTGEGFSAQSYKKGRELKNIGLVTDFKWCDMNEDGLSDIVLVGEWMNIEIFIQNEDNAFERSTKNYFDTETLGWWYSIAVEDLDKDGDLDLVAGNLGLNNKFHASNKKPFDIYFNDFDENGTNDIVLAKMDEGEQYLMRGKDCSSEQMPFIADKYPKYEDFANANIFEVLGEDKLKKSMHYSVKDFSSAWFENVNGKFKRHQLPMEAQFAPINSILIKDINNDGHLDIICAGNLFDTEVETPSYDAGTGNVLLGDGKGNFNNLPYTKSGLLLNKNLKDLAWIKIKGKLHLIGVNNNDVLEFFKIEQ